MSESKEPQAIKDGDVSAPEKGSDSVLNDELASRLADLESKTIPDPEVYTDEKIDTLLGKDGLTDEFGANLNYEGVFEQNDDRGPFISTYLGHLFYVNELNVWDIPMLTIANASMPIKSCVRAVG